MKSGMRLVPKKKFILDTQLVGENIFNSEINFAQNFQILLLVFQQTQRDINMS